VKCEIVRIAHPGDCTFFYTVKLEDEEHTLFDQFLMENQARFPRDLKNIKHRINAIATKTGAQEHFFKPNEGKPGDGVCALFDLPGKNLRLYCIRYGSVAVILGGGGEKPKQMKSLQESEKLKIENKTLRNISAAISKAIKEGLIEWTEDGMSFISMFDTLTIEI
jgi:hypothetical protein